jgi:DNA polymerase III epsilon subunit-like protein
MVERAELLGSRAPKLRELLKRYPIVTYNGRRFDLPVLRNELIRVGFPMDGATMVDVDVFDHVRRHYAGQRGRPKSRKLADQLDFFKIAKGRSHRAADDAEATGKLLLRLIAEGYAPRSLELLKST